LPTKEETVLVIACAGALGWLLMLLVALLLSAAAKRGDELEHNAQRDLPDAEGAKVIPLRPDLAGNDDPPGRPVDCGATSCSIRRRHGRP
jgi:hypothetical protein